ncbi:MFS transporter [Gordoniibacillus kamchatkensis]
MRIIIRPGALRYFAIIAVVAVIFCIKAVPETNGKTLEQIERLWESGR